MEGKKISFGFMKTKKVEKLPVQEKKDYIECLEEKSIKVVGGEDIKEEAPLVIPMKPNTLITAERLQEIANKVESSLVEPEILEPAANTEKKPVNETLDQMVVRELLEDSKKLVKVETSQLALTLPAKSVAGGEKESTLDDYESVPVQDFGMAMLRGMGWTSTDQKSAYKQPPLRPKGLGLGADKVVKDNQKQKAVKNSRDEELSIVKNAFVKITTGKYSGYYGKVLSLDEDNGRVMVDITVKKETVSLSEFMMHPVTRSEFDKESKVINASSFAEYKKNEGQRSKNPEKESTPSERNNGESSHGSKSESKTRSMYNDSKDSDRRDRDEEQSERRHRDDKHSERDRKQCDRDKSNREKNRDSSKEHRKKNKRDSSLESLVDSDSETNDRKKDQRKNKEQCSSMESLDSDTENRRKERRRRDNKSSSKNDKEPKRLDSELESDHRRKKSKQRRRRDSNSDSNKKHSKDVEWKRHDSDSLDHGRSKRDKLKDSSSESDRKRSDTPEGKRDIDKKRKGKKKKRDRDRSPHYRKHKK